VAAHATPAIPFVTLVVLLRLASFEDHLEEQAFDLGAPAERRGHAVLLPMLDPRSPSPPR
jgi:spermidine/putrescine transport system permease protein